MVMNESVENYLETILILEQKNGSVRSIDIANYLLDNGSDGLVVCGTTGENPTMSRDEKLALFNAIAKECGHKGCFPA